MRQGVKRNVGLCQGARGYATSVMMYNWDVPGNVRVCQGVTGCDRICQGVLTCVGVCLCIMGTVTLCQDVPWYIKDQFV